jgi:hypothetical protein
MIDLTSHREELDVFASAKVVHKNARSMLTSPIERTFQSAVFDCETSARVFQIDE